MAPLLSIADAAPLLGLTIHGVRKLVARSRRAADGEPVKGRTIAFLQDGRGSTIRFRPEHIQEYLDRITIDPGNGNGNGNKKPRAGRGLAGGKLDWADLN